MLARSLFAVACFGVVGIGCGSSDDSNAPADTNVVVDGGSETSTADAKDSAENEAIVDAKSDSAIEVATDASDASDATETVDAVAEADVGGKPCNVKTGGCDPSTEFCDAPACDNGTCKAKPTSPSATFDPVCGCDGVTYWNAEQGEAQGASVRAGSTACTSPDAKTCGGFTAKPCTSVETCVIDASAPATCSVADFGGRCWYVPPGATCPTGSADYRQCEGSTPSSCTTYCGAVSGKQIFFKDPTCP